MIQSFDPPPTSYHMILSERQKLRQVSIVVNREGGYLTVPYLRTKFTCV